MGDIRADIRAQIASGQYRAGERLPRFRDLMAAYGISKATLDRALRDLEAEGLLTRRQGAGIYVRRREVVTRDLIAGWRMESERAETGQLGGGGLFEAMTGAQTDVQVTYREMTAAGRIAETLGLEEDARVLERTFRYTVDGAPHQVVRSYMPITTAQTAALEPEKEVPGTGTMLQLRQAGITVTRVRLEIQARMPSAAEARELALQPETPVFEHHRDLLGDSGEHAAETSITIVPADRIAYLFTADLRDAG